MQTEEDSKDEWAGAYIYDDTDVIVLHRFFEKHADKIGKELLSISKPSIDGDSTGVAGKRAWDGLCTLLVDLGAPIEVPRLSTQDSEHHQEYCDLMFRYADKPTTKVKELFTSIRRPGVGHQFWDRQEVLTNLPGFAGFVCFEARQTRRGDNRHGTFDASHLPSKYPSLWVCFLLKNHRHWRPRRMRLDLT